MIALFVGLLVLIAAAIVFIEGLNKLHRTDLRGRRGLFLVSEVLRALAWGCATVAAAGLPFADDLSAFYLHLGYKLAMLGFACMVVRSRVREYLPKGESPLAANDSGDGFERTQVVRQRGQR